MKDTLGLAGKSARAFINSKLTPLLITASILLGVGAVIMLPREEEPQIIVPMIDVFVQMPGASAKEVEERVTKPMEKLLWEVPGVEYVYSTSSPGSAMAVVRFYVGQNEEASIVRLNQKMSANFDLIPPGASLPIVKPRSIDDVPILALTLSSDRYDHFMLRRIAAQVHDQIKEVADVSEVKIIGGQRRQIRVTLDEARMAAHSIAPAVIPPLLEGANRQLQSGSFAVGNREFLVETGGFLYSVEDVGNVVVGTSNNRPVYLRDVSQIEDGPEEPVDYVFYGTGPAYKQKHERDEATMTVLPAVTISISKRKGTNAINVANHVLEKVESLRGNLIPADVRVADTRNYGETAREKSNELLLHMMIAVISVSVLIWLVLGLREAGIVATAIPVTLALTLTVFYFYGYTLNRITLFALIFSIGILVDDAIVVVENMARHYALPENRGRSRISIAIEAVAEVGNPTILATFAVIAAILPMAFVSGLMGPYMRPIPIGASAAMVFSLLVAFIVTPWASLRLLKQHEAHTAETREGWTTRLYRLVMGKLIREPRWRFGFLALVGLLLLGSFSLVFLKFVRVKMLPFDNKSEFQVIVDMPEGSTLEQTAAITREIGDYVRTIPEVADYQMYVGTASPYNFNGLVRHYFLRRGSNVADIQVNLAPKGERKTQSHDIAKRVRPGIQRIAEKYLARVKVSEVPPGPPVLQTLVAEVYGPNYERQLQVARQIRDIFDQTNGVVDVDSYIEDEQTKFQFVVDKEKAALNGVSTEQVAATLRIAVNGVNAGLVHQPQEKEDFPIFLRLPLADRSSIDDLKRIKVVGDRGNLVALGELVAVTPRVSEQSIYHKNLMPVVYVTGDVAGQEESPVYAILKLNQAIEQLKLPEGYGLERYVASQPFNTSKLAMKWDGEWHITYEVFRDLGLAFAAVLVMIYILVVGWFQSFKTPFTIMAAIPFSLVGILPAHSVMGAFFTATSMIGFIAGAGIVVRNSVILVDFIQLRLRQGMPLADAVIDAGAVRFRPMMLTAAAVIVGSAVILFDPIFQGLAISLMAGEVASLFLSRMTVPILFYLSERTSHERALKTSSPIVTSGDDEPQPAEDVAAMTSFSVLPGQTKAEGGNGIKEAQGQIMNISENVEDVVRSKYGTVAESNLTSDLEGVRSVAEAFGYSTEELASIPAAANMGLSCGNPVATANLREGEVVVDLGSGGGLDVFLASARVGPTGKAIGIDMTPEMVELARRNAAGGKAGEPYTNVEFHLATIDKLPLADDSVDCVISNCVINLAPDKPAVFREIARVLKPGGRLAVSDIALKKELPSDLASSVRAYVGCIAGALLIDDYQQGLKAAGFSQVEVVDSGADLNVYAKLENEESCCSATRGLSSIATSVSSSSVDTGCCQKSEAETLNLEESFAALLQRYNVNDYAASVKIYAVK